MKKLICFLLLLALLLPFSASADVDLSGLSFDELVALREQLNLLLWNSAEWKHVEVPKGVYVVGRDIPAGHWTLKPPAGGSVTVEYFKDADATGMNALDTFSNYFSDSLADEASDFASFVYTRELDLDLKDGFYLSVVNGPCVVFEPFVSKPAFSFD